MCYGHQRDFMLKDEKPVAHFLADGHEWEDLCVVGLERVSGGNDTLWVVRDVFRYKSWTQCKKKIGDGEVTGHRIDKKKED
jgi:hypothetical protein